MLLLASKQKLGPKCQLTLGMVNASFGGTHVDYEFAMTLALNFSNTICKNRRHQRRTR